MTPKEKADEIFIKFSLDLLSISGMDDETFEINKKFSLIVVNEVINSSPSAPILSDNGSFGSDIEESTAWWKEVREELLKL